MLANRSHDVGNTGAHELGHTGGLSHEWGPDNLDLNGVYMGNSETNLMKGGMPPGYDLTVNQLGYVKGVIKHGYKPTPVIPKIKTPMPVVRGSK